MALCEGRLAHRMLGLKKSQVRVLVGSHLRNSKHDFVITASLQGAMSGSK
jgi:hypothetical protein